MDEKKDTLQQQIAKAKIKIICAGIEEAILLILELYLMINTKGHFIAMVFGVLFMIAGIFFLVSGILDVTMYNKEIETQKYEDIYNAQKASYMVIRKSFDEMDQRLRVIEENSQLPAEEIITAQKAVAKVQISRNKENTDALMNSNDELISQLSAIKDQLNGSNNEMLQSQQKLLDETRKDIQKRIARLTNQIANIEVKIQNGVTVSGQMPAAMPVAPVMNDFDDDLDLMDDIEETADSSLDIDVPMEEADDLSMDSSLETDISLEEPVEMPSEDLDLGISMDEVVEEPSTGDVGDISGLDLDIATEDISVPAPQEEPVMEAAEPELDLEPMAEDIALEESIAEPEVAAEEPAPVEEPVIEEPAPVEEPAVEEAAPVEEPVLAEEPAPVEEEPAPEPESVAPVEIPDVGIDLSDPNRVMSPEEIEKLFASI